MPAAAPVLHEITRAGSSRNRGAPLSQNWGGGIIPLRGAPSSRNWGAPSSGIYSLDPETYLTDVLERIVSGRTTHNRLHELLAWNWKAEREKASVAA